MKKLLLSMLLALGMMSLVGCSDDDDFDSYEYEGDETIEVQDDDDDDDKVYYIEEDDDDYEDGDDD